MHFIFTLTLTHQRFAFLFFLCFSYAAVTEDLLYESALSGFPLVNNTSDMRIRGYIVRRELETLLGMSRLSRL